MAYIGKEIAGQYKILQKLGKGSFGEIFKGVNTSTNEEVAIKLVIDFFNIILGIRNLQAKAIKARESDI